MLTRLLLCSVFSVCLSPLPVARAADPAETPLFLPNIPDAATYTAYGELVGAQLWGKFVIDLKEQRIYYFDPKVYPLHRDFVFAVLLKQPQTRPAISEYNKNYSRQKPRYILGYLAHHLKSDRWDFSFWAGDHIDAAGVRLARSFLLRTFFVKDKDLYFRPESLLQEPLLGELKELPTVTNDELYKQVDYQAFATGRAVGRLHIVPPSTAVDALNFAPEEIVILQESYPDITPVAGIVTATFSTPLSHVNLRARAWRIPNAGYHDAGKRFAALDGQQVLLEVRDAEMVLRKATAAEVAAWRRKKAATVVLPTPDYAVTELRPLLGMHRGDVTRYGAKAANLGEIVSAHLPGVSVPAGFGVPFAAYNNHLQKSGLAAELLALRKDPRYEQDAGFRKQQLAALEKRIIAAPIDAELLAAVAAKIQTDLGGQSVFVRSSTNAEDLPNFNGAGLYYTAPNVKGNEALALAMKKVWASLWSFRAVEERRLFHIDERAAACALLIVVSLPATAAGVLVTRNLYEPDNDHTYTINAQRGLGLRVVDGRTTPEQVVYNLRFPATKLVSKSADATMLVLGEKGGVTEVPVPSKEVVLTGPRVHALVEAVKRIRHLFPYDLDVEWVLEGERVYIVQARAFLGGDVFRPLPKQH
ncbi:MAG TPA: PEP/pyruvate-binding domain-containing protein [Pseudomonadota bacterium]|nr:PEP/pyruvate-binding domain-containing protein [Pseudomonadota bacterium]